MIDYELGNRVFRKTFIGNLFTENLGFFLCFYSNNKINFQTRKKKEFFETFKINFYYFKSLKLI